MYSWYQEPDSSSGHFRCLTVQADEAWIRLFAMVPFTDELGEQFKVQRSCRPRQLRPEELRALHKVRCGCS
jgi:hypothetical protein